MYKRQRFSRIKAFRYLLSRHIDGLEKGELKRNYISQLCKDWKWTRPTVCLLYTSLLVHLSYIPSRLYANLINRSINRILYLRCGTFVFSSYICLLYTSSSHRPCHIALLVKQSNSHNKLSTIAKVRFFYKCACA